ncbi:response regulator [Chloroflexota bacterium]
MPNKILIVDKEKHVRDSSIKSLLRERYDTVEAETGVEALELIEKEDYKLVLFDDNAPGMDGIEVIRRAREISPDILLFMLTGQGTIETAFEAMKLGAVGFIRKPISIEDLTESINVALERDLQNKQN